MATRRHPEVKDPKPAQINGEEAKRGIALLTKRLDDVKLLDPNAVVNQYEIPQFEKMAAAIDDALVRIFGNGTVEYNRYKNASYFNNGPFNYAYAVDISEVRDSLRKSINSSKALLEQAIESLEERLSEPSLSETNRFAPEISGTRIFIVHGRDNGPREAVARFLESLGLNAIILHEQPNRGQTVIEKIETHGNVGFAVVLLTPDDEGCLKGEQLQDRARQNVLLELGYFIGRLGRQRVCVLQAYELEIPSDWRGVINARFDDSDAWKIALAKELKAAGFAVDRNKIMR